MSKFEFLNDFDILSDGEITLRISQKYNGNINDEMIDIYDYIDGCANVVITSLIYFSQPTGKQFSGIV